MGTSRVSLKGPRRKSQLCAGGRPGGRLRSRERLLRPAALLISCIRSRLPCNSPEIQRSFAYAAQIAPAHPI